MGIAQLAFLHARRFAAAAVGEHVLAPRRLFGQLQQRQLPLVELYLFRVPRVLRRDAQFIAQVSFYQPAHIANLVLGGHPPVRTSA